MATGDDAIAAGMDVVAGTADRRNGYIEDNKTRDYIAQREKNVRPVATGGTGASTAAGALTNLGASPSGHNHDGRYIDHGGSDAGQLAIAHGSGRAQFFAGGNYKGMLAYLSDIPGPVDISGKRNYDDGYFPNDVSAKNVYARESFAATSGWTVAYINSDGRLSKGASSERYKKYIADVAPEDLGDIFPQLVRYQMRSQQGSRTDNAWHVGHIAERLAEHPDQEPFVVYADIDGETLPDSIDFIALLLAQTSQLHHELGVASEVIANLTARVEKLEENA